MLDISVIIPVYNTGKYLKKSIESALPREGQNIELIVVDDGSTDNSATICDDLRRKYPEIIKVIHKTNGGLSDARNVGIDNSHGRYLLFLDSDDMFANGLYDWIITKLNYNFDIIEFDCLQVKKRKNMRARVKNKSEILSAGEEIERLLKNKIGDQICRRAYKKELFNDIKFPKGKHYEDMFTYYKLVLKSNYILSTTSQYYIYYIANPTSITNTINEKNMMDLFEAVNEKCKGVTPFCVKNGINMAYIEYYKRFYYTYIYHKVKKYGLSNELSDYISAYLNENNDYNFFENKDYIFNSRVLLKTWIYYEVSHLFGLM